MPLQDESTVTREQHRAIDRKLYEALTGDSETEFKQASDTLRQYTRTKVREGSIIRRILPLQMVTKDDLSRFPNTDQPIMIFDREPNSPAAIEVAFRQTPDMFYLQGDRYAVTLNRQMTSMWSKDVDELHTWHMDLRRVVSDNQIKDLIALEDGGWLRSFLNAAVGVGVAPPTAGGAIQHQEIIGGFTRDSVFDAFKIIPSTPSHFEAKTLLVNNVTINDLCKATGNEIGKDIVQEITRDGWTMDRLSGRDLIITNKTNLVPNNRMMLFADPDGIGKFVGLYDATLIVRRDDNFLKSYAQSLIGGAIGNPNSFGVADFV